MSSTSIAPLMWLFPKIVVPQNGWFIRESPIKIDDLGGFPPIFGFNTHVELDSNLFNLATRSLSSLVIGQFYNPKKLSRDNLKPSVTPKLIIFLLPAASPRLTETDLEDKRASLAVNRATLVVENHKKYQEIGFCKRFYSDASVTLCLKPAAAPL